MTQAVTFVSWVRGGIAELTSADITDAHKDLTPVADDEKVLGQVEGDLLKLFAFATKHAKRNNKAVEEHLLEALKSGKPPQANDPFYRQAEINKNRFDILMAIFWDDARSQLGDKATPVIGLRAGMKLVESKPDPEPELDVSVALPLLLSLGRRAR